jgi:hypothetical protein
MSLQYKAGIYEHPFRYTVKIVNVKKVKAGQEAEMYFTNNPEYGKSRFWIEGEHLTEFLDGYSIRQVKRKK